MDVIEELELLRSIAEAVLKADHDTYGEIPVLADAVELAARWKRERDRR